MTSRRERRARRRRAEPRPQNPPRPRNRPLIERRSFAVVTTVAVLIFAAALGTAGYLWADQVRDALIAAPCRLGDCAPPAMAAGGWVTVALLPAALAVVAGPRLPRWHPVWQVVVGLIAATLLLTDWLLFVPPGAPETLAQPGGEAFATGLRWGWIGLGATVVALLVGELGKQRRPELRWLPPTLMSVTAALSLAVALARA